MTRWGSAAVLGVVLSCALVGCGGTEEQVATAVPAVAAPAELPEGDPGTAAPEVPEPTSEGEEHGSEGAALVEVPGTALLDPETVGGAAGGTWTAAPGTSPLAPACSSTDPLAGGSRTTALEDGAGRRLVETVTSYAHGDDAEAVAALGAALPGCGWDLAVAPRLGETSLAATRSEQGERSHLTAVSAEGALVVLVAQGGLGDDPDVWEALADAALGTACVAAPEGCH